MFKCMRFTCRPYFIRLCFLKQVYRAVGKVLLTLVVSIRQLLILSGDVELNPGPLGQHGDGEVTCATNVP